MRCRVLGFGLSLALGSLLAGADTATATSVQASVETSLFGGSGAPAQGDDFEEKAGGRAEASSLSLHSTLGPLPTPSGGELQSAAAVGTARLGQLDASAEVRLSSDSATTTHPNGTSTARAHFHDEVSLENPLLFGQGGSFRALLDFDSLLDASSSDTAGSVASADYLVQLQFGDTLLTWVGGALDSPALSSDTASASMTVDGVLVPNALPDALPSGLYLTPDIPFVYGEAFLIGASIDVLTTAALGAPGGEASRGASEIGLGWEGMQGLLESDAVMSQSGSDWRGAVPEPRLGLLLLAAVLASARRRSR